MNKISQKILLTLINKYERSVSFSNGKMKKIYLSLKDEVLGEMYNSSFNNDKLYEDAFKELKVSNFVYFENENEEKFRIVLNINEVEKIYKALGKDNPKNNLLEEKEYLLKLLQKYQNNEVLRGLLLKSIEKVDNLHIPKSIYKSHDNLEIILKGIDGIMSNKENILLRNLSIKLFSDSKTLEKNSEVIFQRMQQFSTYSFRDFFEFCECFNVNKNIGFVYVKGNIELNLNGEIIDLGKLGIIFAIPSDLLNNNLVERINVKKIMTIENETTFNYFNDPSYLYVFSKGHPTQRVITFLRLLSEFNPNLEYYHCGDIDWGGFNIYFDLVEKTGIKFNLYNMDIQTLITYNDYLKVLTNKDRDNLLSLSKKEKVKSNSSINETIIYMLKNNCKLEQEAIS